MVRFLYNLALIALAPAAVPYWVLRSLAKGHLLASLPEALGRVPVRENSTHRPSVWFHAVSVGEVLSSLPLVRSLHRSMPGVPIHVSTGTATGRKLAEEKLGDVATSVFRAPLDFPWCVALVLRRLRPGLLIIAETELWPNYCFEARRFGASVMIANGRISDRSAPKYRTMRFLFRAVLDCVDRILVQSDRDRRRFIDAGAHSSRIVVNGNFKYDFDSRASEQRLAPALESALERSAPAFVLVAGSTRESEEAMIAPALQEVASRVPGTLLIVAPRHPYRFAEAEVALQSIGLPVHRRSRLRPNDSMALPAVLLLDSLGELASLYGRADLVFVGGSLNGWGGHNVLEPVLCGKPVVVGPHMQNFRQIASGLREAGGLIQVEIADLRHALAGMATDAVRRRSVAAAGLAYAQSQQGATERAMREAARLYRSASPRRPAGRIRTVALGLPSAVWRSVANFRRRAHGSGLFRSRRLAVPVVSVGNIVAGGTGKTPATAWLVERLWEKGLVSGVLTRGYGRRKGNRMVLFGTTGGADPRAVGDEPAMLARRLAATAPGTRFAVHSDRFLGGLALERRGGIDLFVLDDGYQHLGLRRTLDIVLLDAATPFDNGHTLPLGRLREPQTSLEDADIIVLTRCEPDRDYGVVLSGVAGLNHRAKVFRSTMEATCLRNVETGVPCPVETLAGTRVGAFCGIGNPQSFFRELGKLGFDCVLRRSYRDHHRYSARDRSFLNRAAAESGAEAFLTTAKDAMNLGDPAGLTLPAYALEIELRVEEADKLLARVMAAVGGSEASRG